jgi:hypothetical protein
LGAVRAAEWLAGKSGVWEFREIFEHCIQQQPSASPRQ